MTEYRNVTLSIERIDEGKELLALSVVSQTGEVLIKITLTDAQSVVLVDRLKNVLKI